jgi:hypothetical protein
MRRFKVLGLPNQEQLDSNGVGEWRDVIMTGQKWDAADECSGT